MWKLANLTGIRPRSLPLSLCYRSFVCGPPPMIKFACEPAFKELGFEEGQWFAF
jgi:NAD(P)H-flavin reductase